MTRHPISLDCTTHPEHQSKAPRESNYFAERLALFASNSRSLMSSKL